MLEIKLDLEVDLPEQVKKIFTLLDENHFFEDGLLVGSWAFIFYREIFGIEYVLRTDDIDFAFTPEVLKKRKGADLESAFAAIGFDPVMDILTGLQKFLADTFEIEFLIHRKGAREETVSVSKYNVNAQPLPFLDMLFVSPIVVITSKFRVRIPSPEALFLHKLIIAQRRKKEFKREKDLEQCAVLAEHLDSDRLASLVECYRMSKTTEKNVRKSCEAIDISADFLRIE